MSQLAVTPHRFTMQVYIIKNARKYDSFATIKVWQEMAFHIARNQYDALLLTLHRAQYIMIQMQNAYECNNSGT